MQQGTKDADTFPAEMSRKVGGTDRLDAEVLALRGNFEGRSPLHELIRTGSRKPLQAAINAELDEFLSRHADRVDEAGRRLVDRNGHLPSRQILTGAGKLKVQQPRVRDNSPDQEQHVAFSPSVLPPDLRKSPALEELIRWLYLNH
jgi:transposase-like protein